MFDLNVTLVQTRLAWEDPAANRGHLETLLGQVQPTDLILLPEMFSTGFSMHPQGLAEPHNGPSVHWLHRMAQETQAPIGGSLMTEEGGQYYNRFYLCYPDGQQVHYDKRHTFRMAGEHETYTPGRTQVVAEVLGWRILLQTCYDLRFPVFCRNTYTGPGTGYDVAVFIANWPERRRHHWRTLLQARAIENQAFVLGVNRTGVDGNEIAYSGDSMAFAPDGSLITEMVRGEGLLTTVLDGNALEKSRAQFPAWRDADRFELGL